MNSQRFIAQRTDAWNELSLEADEFRRLGARRSDPQRVHRMIHLYRQASADLAQLRMLKGDPHAIRWLNRLVTRCHSLIYSGTGRSVSIVKFFTVTYPRLFRECAGCMIASLLLCLGVYALSYEVVQQRPEVVADILGGMDSEFTGAKEAKDITERFVKGRESLGSPLMSSLITTNNIKVALMAFAFGITFGIGTVWMLTVNSAMVGGIAGAFARSGIESTLWATLLPHGALELSAIVIAGGSGFVIGWALWCPGQRTRLRALREESVKAVLLAVGLIPAFIVAGFFEGFVTPSDLPPALKVSLGVGVAALFWAYLLVGGRVNVSDPVTAANAVSTANTAR